MHPHRLARRAAVAAASLAAVAALAAPAADAATSTAPTGDDLFVATAAGGTLTKARGAGAYTLTLIDPAATVSAFTDRPQRQATTQALRAFVADWDDYGFADDPPNAALVLDHAPAAHDTYLFTLSRPRLTGGKLVLAANRVGARPAGALEPIARKADRGAPRGFGRASLFVDDGSQTVPIKVDVKGGGDVVLDFGGDDLALQPSASWWPAIYSYGDTVVDLQQDSIAIQPEGGPTYEAIASVAIDHDGAGPITGVAIVPAGTTVTISVAGGAPVTIDNGPFSLPL